MGEKKNGNKKGGDGEKKEKASLTVVLKVDCLCEGCATKILKYIREFEGVETVKIDSSSNKVTVIGAVDPTAIEEKLLKKTKKKVDIVSPQPKKDDNKEKKKPDEEKNQDSDNKPEKKPKEAPVTTADLKVQLKCQCQGCIVKIRKIVSETKGVHELKVDELKELVTVKGTMDVKALAKALKDKLKKNVEIVPPKKEKDGNNEGGENGGGGGKKNKVAMVVEMVEIRLRWKGTRWSLWFNPNLVTCLVTLDTCRVILDTGTQATGMVMGTRTGMDMGMLTRGMSRATRCLFIHLTRCLMMRILMLVPFCEERWGVMVWIV